MSKSPAFQFYASDYLADESVQLMSLEEEGAYIRLLAYCWREGSIPADLDMISRLCKGASTTVARVVAGCFSQSPTDSTRLVHFRLEAEREKQRVWSEKSSKGGKKSAESKGYKIKGGSRVVQPKGNSSSSSSSSFKEPPIAPLSTPASIEPPSPLAIEPEMIAKAVQADAGVFGIKPLMALTDVCRRELALGIPAGKVRDALVDSWGRFSLARSQLEYAWGAEKFFGEGHWKDEASWPWKGQSNGADRGNQTERVSPAEQRRRNNLAGLANIAARRYGIGPLADARRDNGEVSQPGDHPGDAGDAPRSVGGDGAEVRPGDVSGRIIEGAP